MNTNFFAMFLALVLVSSGVMQVQGSKQIDRLIKLQKWKKQLERFEQPFQRTKPVAKPSEASAVIEKQADDEVEASNGLKLSDSLSEKHKGVSERPEWESEAKDGRTQTMSTTFQHKKPVAKPSEASAVIEKQADDEVEASNGMKLSDSLSEKHKEGVSEQPEWESEAKDGRTQTMTTTFQHKKPVAKPSEASGSWHLDHLLKRKEMKEREARLFERFGYKREVAKPSKASAVIEKKANEVEFSARDIYGVKENIDGMQEIKIRNHERSEKESKPKGNSLTRYLPKTLKEQAEALRKDYNKKKAQNFRPTPTRTPTGTPTTAAPTKAPSSGSPTNAPTKAPTTDSPTHAPTKAPTTDSPTHAPTKAPTTDSPTHAPTKAPTSHAPTKAPTTNSPTNAPTNAPTRAPTTNSPTNAPTRAPTALSTRDCMIRFKGEIPGQGWKDIWEIRFYNLKGIGTAAGLHPNQLFGMIPHVETTFATSRSYVSTDVRILNDFLAHGTNTNVIAFGSKHHVNWYLASVSHDDLVENYGGQFDHWHYDWCLAFGCGCAGFNAMVIEDTSATVHGQYQCEISPPVPEQQVLYVEGYKLTAGNYASCSNNLFQNSWVDHDTHGGASGGWTFRRTALYPIEIGEHDVWPSSSIPTNYGSLVWPFSPGGVADIPGGSYDPITLSGAGDGGKYVSNCMAQASAGMDGCYDDGR